MTAAGESYVLESTRLLAKFAHKPAWLQIGLVTVYTARRALRLLGRRPHGHRLCGHVIGPGVAPLGDVNGDAMFAMPPGLLKLGPGRLCHPVRSSSARHVDGGVRGYE